MGIRSTRPLPLSHAELALAPFFKRRFRSWHLDHVRLVLQRYRLLTSRFCVDALQLGSILGIKEKKLVEDVMNLFLPRTPTRVQCMVDVMEVLIALVLVCQAPDMLQRFEMIFDIVDLEGKGAITSMDLVMLCGAVGRAITKLFEYNVEPEQHATMAYIADVLDSLGVCRDGRIAKEVFCKFMLSDRFAVHYVKQCTGQDKPKLYIMLEKDAEFLGAIEFSDDQQMKTTSLRTVRDMIYRQVHRVPDDFMFLCQGREVKKVWEVDRRAWSIVPFALRGSPGLRTSVLAKNRNLERPAIVSPFEFRYMGNLITRYKKVVHDIKPVYKHRSFRLRKNIPRKTLEPVVQWRVATTWSGDWIYDQSLIKSKLKPDILKRLRAAGGPQPGVLAVKSQFGEILSPYSLSNTVDESGMDAHPSSEEPANTGSTQRKEEKRMQRIVSMSLSEHRHEDKLRKQQVQWKARLIAMEAQHRLEEERRSKATNDRTCVKMKESADGAGTSTMNTILVRIEEDDKVLPSRLVRSEPKKRRRPKKLNWATYRWDIPRRLLSSSPPRCKKIKVSMISDDISLTTTSVASSTIKQIDLGRFLSSTNIFLEENQVEVFPVLVIRPIEDKISLTGLTNNTADENVRPSVNGNSDEVLLKAKATAEKPLMASKSYLTEFEYDISSIESNFETLYQHIASGIMQDAFWLNRRDVMGRTMLHDAAEFGHANLMDLLLKYRVIVDVPDSRGDTALHHAARHGRLKEVSMLLRDHAVPWLLNNEGKSPLYCALETAAKRVARRTSKAKGNGAGSESKADDHKNFFLAHRMYPELRQVIDLLWDHYTPTHLVRNDFYERTNCFELEKYVYGDMIDACHDGNLLRIQRLVDLEKQPVLRYINDQMEFLGRTALHEAAEQGHTSIVDILLKFGANGHLRDQRLQTPLHIAVFRGHDKIVKCLILKFPLATAFQDISGSTPLHVAVQRGYWSIALSLIAVIKSNADQDGTIEHGFEGLSPNYLDLQDIHGYTALHYACIRGNYDVCVALLNSHAAPSISRCHCQIPRETSNLLGLWWKGKKGGTKSVREWKRNIKSSDQNDIIDIEAPIELLLKGCRQNCTKFQERMPILEQLLSSHNKYYRDEGHERRKRFVKKAPPPLFHIAADIAEVNISVAVEICRRIHEMQIEINTAHPTTGEAVLLQECKRVCSRTKRHCVENDQQKDEALGQLALIRKLLELGANVDLANETNGESPLGCAAWNGHLELLDVLLEAGADKDAFLRRNSFSPLHFAALANNVACAKLLIGRAATVNVEVPPVNAETPLYFAIRSKSEEMVELLLRSGANPCSLSTFQQGRTTSFGIILSVPWPRGSIHTSQLGQIIDTELELPDSTPMIGSPLTFGLLMAQSVQMFCVPEELNCTVRRAKIREEWLEMKRICITLAKGLLENNGGSKGVVTRNDVHLASVLGYWDVVQMLLSQQIALSNAPSSFGLNALHLAAAAGQTSVVIALVAGGMNVNCITRGDSSKPKRVLGRRTWYEWGGYGQRGALFYALTHGHVKTAAKLLVLGAHPEETIPHTKKTVRWRKRKRQNGEAVFCEYHVVRFVISEAMTKTDRTNCVLRSPKMEDGGKNGEMANVDRPSVNIIHLIECSINQRVPLLHLVVSLGYVTLVRVLVEAGMSIFTGYISPADNVTDMSGWNAPIETPIHVAVTCGHWEIVEEFAAIVQHNFPGCFVRESKVFKSLLVAACESHQIKILRFLLGDVANDEKRCGGFTYDQSKDEFQSAMRTCAALQFSDGFLLLKKHGAQPDVHTLVSALKGIMIPSRRHTDEEVAVLEENGGKYCVPFPGARYKHDLSVNSVEAGTRLLHMILSADSISDISKFIGTSPVFDLVLEILMSCSYHGLWFVLDKLFVQHQEYFTDVDSIWKPVLVRSVRSCYVMHSAAKDNQVKLIAFFLRLGVPPALQVNNASSTNYPIWHAASWCCLEAFLCLALKSSSFIDNLVTCNRLNALPLFYRSIQESRSILSTSNTTCRWQNFGALACIDLQKRHTKGYLIQKFINYGLLISRGHVDTSLLHHASRMGELLAVETLVEAGADVTATNREGDTPLEVASRRKDLFGLLVVNYLISTLARKDVTNASTILDRALVNCFAETPPCHTKIAQALLDGGANANFSREATEKEVRVFGPIQVSAILYSMRTAQFAGVDLLHRNGAVITVRHSENFLAQISFGTETKPRQRWRRFARFVRSNKTNHQQQLLDIESIMRMLLKKNVFPTAMNPDLVHQMLTSASAMASSVAHQVGLSKNFWGIVNVMLNQYPSEVSKRKAVWNQKAALHYAVASSELSTVARLLEVRGLDVLAEDETKQTPLHGAATGGDESTCRVLLEKQRSNAKKTIAIDVQDIHGRTALHLAVKHGHEATAYMLLDAGASVNVRSNDGLTPLLYAAKYNRLAILIAIYSRTQPKPKDALCTADGEAGIFVAARHGAFSVVRWFLNMREEDASWLEKEALSDICCSFGRTVLHYSAATGDEESLELLLKVASKSVQTETAPHTTVSTLVNARDSAGYTPLMYAFAFGKLRAVALLIEFGSDPYTSVDHSGDPGAHPYTVGFDIAALLQRFALPGWYSFICKLSPSQEKIRLVHAASIDEDYLCNSSYNYRKTPSKRPIEWRCKWKRISAGRLLKTEKPRRGKDQVRTSIRSWRFPQKSLFDYACEIGNERIVQLLVNLHLPQVFCNLPYQAQRRNFMQAVRWNRLEVVKILVASTDPGSKVIMSTTGNHFLDFLELGIDCAVSRGLEDMAIYLLSQWKGIKESKDEIAASSAFAFQFSSAFQIACIRSLPTLVAYMIQRGGEQLVDFQWNEGSALVYAFAFGHTNIAAMLLRNGADLTMPTSTYSAPSVRKWVEFGSPRGVRIAWQPRASTEDPRCKRPEFLGPLGAYEESARGLTIDILCQTFSTINLFSDTDEPSLAVSDDTADGNKPHAAIRTEHDDFLTIVESSDLESDGGITNTTREEDNVPAVDIGSPTID